MQPNSWTELFFLDEATALAAGHRPCGLCRRTEFNAFFDAWQRGTEYPGRPKAGDVDNVLHGERTCRDKTKVTYPSQSKELPSGAMIRDPSARERALLLLNACAVPWSPTGYGRPIARPPGEVDVLTPRSTVAAIRAGYFPRLHSTASTN